ncbi:hypothetical protein JD844_005758 [Phrynosoma platyrhinos]|uniref:UPAR/Ly6 domain-containing protein n=1 Tax=Phrynosoma platyrhinos TaxID=52577 RepID=A0ABQ7TPQ2_PHRPL|nr:hypothetical protein JD844_005758 [Phrynosoma platyrhinos]
MSDLLKCNTCHGEYDCIGENVTCEDPSASCITSVRKAYVSFLEFQSVRKGCARQLYPLESVSINSHLMSLSYQARYCVEDGCNNETYFVSHPPPTNHMRCHTCASQGAWCPEIARTQISCTGDQDQCVDLSITGKLGQYSNLKLKGCANLQRCEDTLSFYSGKRTIHATCCNSPLCNGFTTDFHVLNEAPNGLQCYSCVDDDGSGSGCSEQTMSKVQCTGIHNMCLEGIGNSRKAGRDLGLVTFKGCASPAMCQSSLLALVQELDNADVMCCQGSLCNNRIVNGVITEAKIAADSADTTETPECIKPTPKPSRITPVPDCVYTKGEEEEDDSMVSVHPSAGSHIEKETIDNVNEEESNKNVVTESNTMSHSPDHDDHSVTHEHTVNENLSEGSSQGNTASPMGATGFDHVAGDASSATTNLDKSDSGASTTSSAHHGNVVVLVPVIISRRNNTASSTETSTNSRIVASSSTDNESEDEECETEEEDMTTGEHFIAAKESNRDGSTSNPRSTVVPTGGNSNAGIFVEGMNQDESTSHPASTQGGRNADVFITGNAGSSNVVHGHTVHGHGREDERFIMDESTTNHSPRPGHSTMSSHGVTSGESFIGDNHTPQPDHANSVSSLDDVIDAILPIPYIVPEDNDSFHTEDKNVAGTPAVANTNSPIATSSPVSGAGAGTTRPKNKVPCKRPRSQSQPNAKLRSSAASNKQVGEEILTRDGATTLFSDTKNPGHSGGGKVNLDSGTLGLVSNLGVFSLTFLLVALLH